METILLFIFASLFASSVSGRYIFPTGSYFENFPEPSTFLEPDDCQLELESTDIAAEVEACPAPSYEGVTKEATIENVQANLIQTPGDPGLHVSFEADSQDSPQVYSINVLTSSNTLRPVFCGVITTPNPADGQKRQKFSINMTCLAGTFLSEKSVKVYVSSNNKELPGGSASFIIPKCNDPIMANSAKCKEMKNQSIKFALKQVGNGIQVVLDPDSAYLGYRDEKVFLQLRILGNGGIRGRMPVGTIVKLKYPQRTHTFPNVTPGKVYSVLVWTNLHVSRSVLEILIKPNTQ